MLSIPINQKLLQDTAIVYIFEENKRVQSHLERYFDQKYGHHVREKSVPAVEMFSFQHLILQWNYLKHKRYSDVSSANIYTFSRIILYTDKIRWRPSDQCKPRTNWYRTRIPCYWAFSKRLCRHPGIGIRKWYRWRDGRWSAKSNESEITYKNVLGIIRRH